MTKETQIKATLRNPSLPTKLEKLQIFDNILARLWPKLQIHLTADLHLEIHSKDILTKYKITYTQGYSLCHYFRN